MQSSTYFHPSLASIAHPEFNHQLPHHCNCIHRNVPLRYNRSMSLTLNPDTSLLLIIDMQERLLKVQHEPDSMLHSCLVLIQAAQTLNIPILATTQNANRLGPMSTQMETYIDSKVHILDKITFSVIKDEACSDFIEHSDKNQIVICGVETHICVCQTALQLLEDGYSPFVCADAVTSRSKENHLNSLERMRTAGVQITSVESSIYEWLAKAGTPEFRAILPLFKAE